jgi:hypothetical protein
MLFMLLHAAGHVCCSCCCTRQGMYAAHAAARGMVEGARRTGGELLQRVQRRAVQRSERRRALRQQHVREVAVEEHLPSMPQRGLEKVTSKGVSTSRVSPPGALSISYGHMGCWKTRAFPPPV